MRRFVLKVETILQFFINIMEEISRIFMRHNINLMYNLIITFITDSQPGYHLTKPLYCSRAALTQILDKNYISEFFLICEFADII